MRIETDFIGQSKYPKMHCMAFIPTRAVIKFPR